MSKKTYRVKEVARLARVTVRTLHHYDGIGLLVPGGRTEAGYRLYGDDDLLRLQQILIGRELGLPLERIKSMLDDPQFDRRKALLEQRDLLMKRVRTTEAMLGSVNAALDATKGERTMEARDLFEGFGPAEHEEEVRRRWGGTSPYKEAVRRTKGYTPEDWARIKAEDATLMDRFAEEMDRGTNPADAAAIELAEEHRLHLDRWYYPCSHSMHLGLAGMYLADERFRETFERRAEGLAEFVAGAIRANAAGGRPPSVTPA